MQNIFSNFLSFSVSATKGLVRHLEDKNKTYAIFFLIYLTASLLVWKKYGWNPSSQINFGKEFVKQNAEETPKGAIVFLGEEGNLGAGYDGQIFYYYSRMLSNFSLDWPKGFETSFRAPRIGYPLLVSPFGWVGPLGTVFGMYFLNLALLAGSYLAFRNLLPEGKKFLAAFYLLSPFTLGSYILLVSDAVMVGLLVLSYWAYKKEKFLLFSLLGGLSVLTKEQSLFLLFPLGLEAIYRKEWRKTLWIGSVLLLPGLWSLYLRTQFPNWTPAGLGQFFDPLGGILGYLGEIRDSFLNFQTADSGGFRGLAKKFSRFPLLVLLLTGLFLLLRGRIKLGFPFRLGFGIAIFTVFAGGYVLYWATYENVSRMFTVTVPILLLWHAEDENLPVWPYLGLCGLVLVLFFVKLAVISKPLQFIVW